MGWARYWHPALQQAGVAIAAPHWLMPVLGPLLLGSTEVQDRNRVGGRDRVSEGQWG